ncbi:hypothetical protein TNCV_2508651 [Trichonephila clavipes]|nr:hypothetical protein TNCV_2508651 [Trichonephila clavipes]
MSLTLVPLKICRTEGTVERNICRGSNDLSWVWCESYEKGLLAQVLSSSLDHVHTYEPRRQKRLSSGIERRYYSLTLKSRRAVLFTNEGKIQLHQGNVLLLLSRPNII